MSFILNFKAIFKTLIKNTQKDYFIIIIIYLTIDIQINSYSFNYFIFFLLFTNPSI